MSKYEKFSKEELLALVEKQDNELVSKKYGLVWDSEREPEQVVLDCEHNLPVLKRVKGKEIKESKDKEDNILIEGDNYHALTVLNYTHQNKIDVIYIDPPYNTGNEDFKYNDKFIDREDGFRHSKWLSFMEKRLNLAKNLLSQDGVIFISIDENEFANLKLLCDKIFSNFLGIFTWQKKYGGGNDSGKIATEHEYIISYSKNPIEKEWLEPHTDDYLKRYSQEDEFGRYFWDTLERPGLNNPIRAKIKFEGKVYELLTFRSQERINEELKTGEIKVVKIGNRVSFQFKQRLREGKKPRSILRDAKEEIDGDLEMAFMKVGSNSSAKSQLRNILNDNLFNNPKPTDLINYLIKITGLKNGIVLDFFAGSGTTGHAVQELNMLDGENRKFILCTNNENKICEEVTYPRMKNVIKGYKKNGNGEKVEGLGGNLQYFKTDLIKQTKNKDQLRVDLTQKCTEMLCVKENIFNIETEKEDYKIFSSNKRDNFLCVYYNLFDESFKDFLKEVKKLIGKKKVYMFSIDGRIDRKFFAEIKDCEIEEIPQKIIDVYKQLIKMNIPVKMDTIFLEFKKANKKIFKEKEKDESARILRIVLEKTIQKIAQKNNMSIFKDNHKEEKIAVLNDKLKESKVFSQIQWEENKTYLTIGNDASHGDYDEYTLAQIENFYKHIQSLFNDFGI